MRSRRLWAAVGLSLLPDLDAVVGLLVGDFGRFHNNLTHSLFVGLAVALGLGFLVWLFRRSGFWRWFTLAFWCYEFHLILDALNTGRGVMLLWPFSTQRYESPIKIFYGVRWSEGLFALEHLWTLANEIGFALVCLLLIFLYESFSRKFSPDPHWQSTSSEGEEPVQATE